MKFLSYFFQTEYHPKLIEPVIKANFSGAIIVNLFLPIIIYYLFFDSIPQIALKIWVGTHFVIFLLRISLQMKIKKNINIHLFLLTTTSILYAILSWQALLYSDQIHLLLVAMIIASIVAGSIATIVSIYHMFFIFVTIQMLGLISAFFYINQDIFYLSALMATSFLHLVLMNGYKQYKNIKETLRLNQQVHTLLNNTGEGFLSFDANMRCQSSFSSECIRIFQTDKIENSSISKLLFKNNIQKKELFEEAIKRSLATEDSEMIEMFLSLIPHEHTLNNYEIAIECKDLKNGLFMLKLKDITATNRLKFRIEYQKKVQQLLVNVASNRNDFLDLKNDFEKLLHSLYMQKNFSLELMDSIKKELHTFKGNFSQKGMIYISNYIHQLELKIQNLSSNDEIIATCLEANLQENFNKDIAVIDSALGKDFLNSDNTLSVYPADIDEIEFKLKSFIYKFDLEQQIALNTILSDIHQLKNIPIMELLKPYISYVSQISLKLEKEISPLIIQGDESLKISPRLKPFMKQLVHVFNNAIDHGIEDIDIRDSLEKENAATIICDYQVNANILLLTISDDGSGIDTTKLAEIALKKGIITEKELKEMEEEDLCKLIFEEHLTTKTEITTISGIGIGLNALKNELDTIGGKVSIQNKKGEGLKFIFYIPLHKNKNLNLFYGNSKKNHCDKIITTLITQSELFIRKSIDSFVSTNTNANLEISDTDLYFSQIELKNGFNGLIILIYSKKILEAFSDFLIPEGYEADEKEEILQEVANETINTVVGLSLQYFDKELNEIEISPPTTQNIEYLFTLMHTERTRAVATIETRKGTLGLIVLNEDS